MKTKLLILVGLASASVLGADLPQNFTYQGRLLNEQGTQPISQNVHIILGIYDPAGACLLYEEEQDITNLAATDGSFSIKVGSAAGSSKRSPDDPNLSMQQILANSGQVRAPGANCASGFTPTAQQGRKLKVKLAVGGGALVSVAPDLDLSPVPYALVAESVQGKKPSDFIQVQGSVTQANVESLVGGSDVGTLHNHDAAYATKSLESTVSGLSSTVASKADSSTVSALSTTVNGKADQSSVTSALALKADSSTVSALSTTVNGKADQSSVTSSLALKADLAGAQFSGPVSTTSQISYKVFNIASGSAVDWNNGQIQSMTLSVCGAISMSNMKDGGSYTLALTISGAAGATCSFSTDSGSGSIADASFKAAPDKYGTASKTTVFNFQRIGTTVYMTNAGPF